MADPDNTERPEDETGLYHLSWAWWEAIGDLCMIIQTSEDSAARMRASEIILKHCEALNVGIGEPFLPDQPRPIPIDPEEEE